MRAGIELQSFLSSPIVRVNCATSTTSVSVSPSQPQRESPLNHSIQPPGYGPVMKTRWTACTYS
jgi:hypothetical protein